MLEVTITYDVGANRAPDTVKLHNYDKLTPKTAIAARNVAAGVGANAHVSDGNTVYRVTGNKARKV